MNPLPQYGGINGRMSSRKRVCCLHQPPLPDDQSNSSGLLKPTAVFPQPALIAPLYEPILIEKAVELFIFTVGSLIHPLSFCFLVVITSFPEGEALRSLK